MKALRILYILANEPTGGVGVFVRDFTTHFSNQVTVDYLMYTKERNTKFQKSIQNDQNHIYYLPDLSVRSYKTLLKLTDEFFKEHASKYQIVHLTYPGIVKMCFEPAKKYGIKYRIIHSFNASLSDNPVKSNIYKLLVSNYKKYANCYLACSKEAAEFLYGKNTKDVVYIHNAIDCEQYKFDSALRNKLREKYNVENKKVFICAGRLEKQKNIGFAIDVFNEIVKKEQDSCLFVVGDGPYKEEYIGKVKNYKLDDKVKFISFTSSLNELFLVSDLLLFPSLYEGLPLTVVDAENSGLACLLANTISKEVSMTNQVQFASLDESKEKWAEEAIEMCLYNRKDETDNITKKGYNILHEANKLEKYYESLCER